MSVFLYSFNFSKTKGISFGTKELKFTSKICLILHPIRLCAGNPKLLCEVLLTFSRGRWKWLPSAKHVFASCINVLQADWNICVEDFECKIHCWGKSWNSCDMHWVLSSVWSSLGISCEGKPCFKSFYHVFLGIFLVSIWKL